MRTGLVRDLRSLLRAHPDGFTAAKLAELTDRDKYNVTKYLKFMPDTYIDRWEQNGQRYTPIWCVVTPPDDCPHPTKEVVAVRPRGRRDFAGDAPVNRETND